MAVNSTILPKRYANVITRHEQKKTILSHSTYIGNKRKQTENINTFVISNIVSIVTYPLRKQIIMKLIQFGIYFNVADQVHIVNKEKLLQNVDI